MKSPKPQARKPKPRPRPDAQPAAGGLGAVAAADPPPAAPQAPEAPLDRPAADAPTQFAQAVPAMSPEQMAQNVWENRMSFALGASLNTLHTMCSSGVDPVMGVMALLRAAGMGMEFYGLADRVSPSVEVLLGRQRQAEFQAAQRRQAGQEPS
jgi:hypothetical protein